MDMAKRIVEMFKSVECDAKQKSIITVNGESTDDMFDGIIFVQKEGQKKRRRFKLHMEMDTITGTVIISECNAV